MSCTPDVIFTVIVTASAIALLISLLAMVYESGHDAGKRSKK